MWEGGATESGENKGLRTSRSDQTGLLLCCAGSASVHLVTRDVGQKGMQIQCIKGKAMQYAARAKCRAVQHELCSECSGTCIRIRINVWYSVLNVSGPMLRH